MKRSRGRGRRPQNNHSRAFNSTGPDVKIRGTASHVYEKYLQLARDAGSAGDRVMAENYLQHAEHYFRILLAQGIQPGQQQGTPAGQQPNGGGDGRIPPGTDQPSFPQPVSSAPSFTLAEAKTTSKKATKPPERRVPRFWRRTPDDNSHPESGEAFRRVGRQRQTFRRRPVFTLAVDQRQRHIRSGVVPLGLHETDAIPAAARDRKSWSKGVAYGIRKIH